MVVGIELWRGEFPQKNLLTNENYLQLSNMAVGPNYTGRAFDGRPCEQTSMHSQGSCKLSPSVLTSSPRPTSLDEITHRTLPALLLR